jgi:thiamine biosynthesis lipoprotein
MASDLRRQLLVEGDGRHLRFAHPATRLDPGAVGKGWALDRATARLRDAGVRRALVHGGTSTAFAAGDEPGREGWTIAIRDPRSTDGILAHARLRDASLSVSGQHGRTVAVGGRPVGHILDPRSGRPVDHTLLTAVVHASAMVSDALSTALLVLGADGIDLIARRIPDAQFLLLASDGSTHAHGKAFQ